MSRSGKETLSRLAEGVNEHGRGTEFTAERDAFWRIATERMMPKGSVFRATNGGYRSGPPLRPAGTILAKGIEILIILGADKNGREGLAAPTKLEELLTIRKTFSGIEVIN